MPLLAGALAWLSRFLVTWAAYFFGKKAVTYGVSITAFVLFTLAFVACIRQITETVQQVAHPPAWLMQGIGMFVPFDFDLVIGMVWSSYACRWAYDIAVAKIYLANNAG